MLSYVSACVRKKNAAHYRTSSLEATEGAGAPGVESLLHRRSRETLTKQRKGVEQQMVYAGTVRYKGLNFFQHEPLIKLKNEPRSERIRTAFVRSSAELLECSGHDSRVGTDSPHTCRRANTAAPPSLAMPPRPTPEKTQTTTAPRVVRYIPY